MTPSRAADHPSHAAPEATPEPRKELCMQPLGQREIRSKLLEEGIILCCYLTLPDRQEIEPRDAHKIRDFREMKAFALGIECV